MSNYKLTEKKRNGYKSFPKGLVEGIFWDKVKQKLSDVLENLLSRVTALEAGGSGGGGGSSIVECSITEWPVSGSQESFYGVEQICSTLGITEQDLDNIRDGNVLAIKICHYLFPLDSWGAEGRGAYPDDPNEAYMAYGKNDDGSSFKLEFNYSQGEPYVNISPI